MHGLGGLVLYDVICSWTTEREGLDWLVVGEGFGILIRVLSNRCSAFRNLQKQ